MQIERSCAWALKPYSGKTTPVCNPKNKRMGKFYNVERRILFCPLSQVEKGRGYLSRKSTENLLPQHPLITPLGSKEEWGGYKKSGFVSGCLPSCKCPLLWGPTTGRVWISGEEEGRFGAWRVMEVQYSTVFITYTHTHHWQLWQDQGICATGRVWGRKQVKESSVLLDQLPSAIDHIANE